MGSLNVSAGERTRRAFKDRSATFFLQGIPSLGLSVFFLSFRHTQLFGALHVRCPGGVRRHLPDIKWGRLVASERQPKQPSSCPDTPPTHDVPLLPVWPLTARLGLDTNAVWMDAGQMMTTRHAPPVALCRERSTTPENLRPRSRKIASLGVLEDE